MIREPLALATAVVALAGISFWLGGRFAWARKLSPTLLVILLGAALSNAGLVAAKSPVYAFIAGPLTSLAIVWLLLAVDLRDLRRAGPRMLAAFGLGVLGTVLGALAATVAFRSSFGADAWKLAGTLTGTYSGGGLNFVAVGRAVELPESLFAAATAADNVLTAVWIGATLVLPVWLGRYYVQAPAAPEGRKPQDFHALLESARFSLSSLGALAALGLGLVLAAENVAAYLPGPTIIWLTTLALLAGHLPIVRRLEGALFLGTFALTLFFAVLGIWSRVAEVLAVGVEVFYFTALVVLVHGVVIYGGARLLRLDIETTSVASQAAVGGPSTALALAVSRERSELALPGTVVGLLGYAIGNYAGLTVAALVRSLG